MPRPRALSVPPRHRRPGRAPWSVVTFLALYAMGLSALAYYYMVPATRALMAAKQDADLHGQRAIGATATLLLMVALLVLVSGIVITFRVGRYFFPRKTAPRTTTRYVDAWAESGKRMATPPADEPGSENN